VGFGIVRSVILLPLTIPLACIGDKAPSGVAASASAVESSAPARMSATPSVTAGASGAAPAVDAGAPRHERRVIRFGTAGAVLDAARRIDSSEEQKAALDAIDEKLWVPPKDDEVVGQAYRELVAAIIAGVNEGRIDDKKLAPHYAVLEKVTAERRSTEARALNELHEVLRADQRKALAALLRKRHPPPGATPEPAVAPVPAQPRPVTRPHSAARPELGKPAPPPKPAKSEAEIEKERALDHAKRRNARVTSLLGLDTTQSQRVEPILARYDAAAANKKHREELSKRMQRLIDAFERDAFDATQLDLGKGPRARMQQRVELIKALLMILKADQRDKLARTIERPSARRWGGAVVGEDAPAEDE